MNHHRHSLLGFLGFSITAIYALVLVFIGLPFLVYLAVEWLCK